MLREQKEENSQERLGELTELLARGYLRLLLSENENRQDNPLKRLDKPKIASMNWKCS